MAFPKSKEGAKTEARNVEREGVVIAERKAVRPKAKLYARTDGFFIQTPRSLFVDPGPALSRKACTFLCLEGLKLDWSRTESVDR